MLLSKCKSLTIDADRQEKKRFEALLFSAAPFSSWLMRQ